MLELEKPLSFFSRIAHRNAPHWPLAGQVWIALAGLIAATLSARILGPAPYGQFFLALTVTSTAAVATDLCVSQAILTRSTGYLQYAKTWRLLATATAAITSIAVALIALFFQGTPDSALMWVILCMTVPLTMASMTPRAFLVMAGELRLVAMVDVSSILVGNGLSVLLLLHTPLLAYAALGQVLVAAIRILILEFAWIKGGKGELPDIGHWRSAWKSLRFAVAGAYQSQLAGFVARNGDNIVVSALLGPVNLAQYSRAFSFLIGPLQQAQMALNPMMLRDLAEAREQQNIRAELRRISMLLVILMVPLAVILSVFGPTLVDTLLGPGWSAAGRLMAVSSIFAISTVIALPARWFLIVMRDTKRLTIDSAMQYSLVAGCAIGAICWGLQGSMAVNSWVLGPLIALVEWLMLPRGIRDLLWRVIVPWAVALGSIALAGSIVIRALVADDLNSMFLALTLYILLLITASGIARRLQK